MARYQVYPSTDPTTSQAINNLAAAFFPDQGELARAEANLMSGYKSGEDIRMSQQKRGAYNAAADAMAKGDLAAAIAEGMRSGEGGYIKEIPGANLGYYAAGGVVPALPAGDPNDPLRDPTMTRLQMGAQMGAGNTGLGYVFGEEQATDRSRYTADQNLKGTRYTADKRLQADLDKNQKDWEAARVKAESERTDKTVARDPEKFAKAQGKISEDIMLAARTALGHTTDTPVDPQVLADVELLANQYVSQALANGQYLSANAATALAIEEVRKANSGLPAELGTNWYDFWEKNRRGYPKAYRRPEAATAADVFAPLDLTGTTTTTVKGKQTVTLDQPVPTAEIPPVVVPDVPDVQIPFAPGQQPTPAAPAAPALPPDAQADFAAAKAAIAKGKDPNGVIQKLLAAGYTREQLTAAGF